MAACATLSTAETPKDRARSARRMRRGLMEKGAVHAVGAMFRPVAPVRGTSHVGTKGGPMQTFEFIDGDRGGPRGTDGTPSPAGGGTEGTAPLGAVPLSPLRTPLADLEAVAELVA